MPVNRAGPRSRCQRRCRRTWGRGTCPHPAARRPRCRRNSGSAPRPWRRPGGRGRAPARAASACPRRPR
ncbi:hypothetical protein DAT35_36470 [Vitiosangium sp. GDMCC 1.1324]|nr:hypothetical protein DAT35_36470 [Vitiosangium sp. GDMCC 1.1324]